MRYFTITDISDIIPKIEDLEKESPKRLMTAQSRGRPFTENVKSID